MSRQIYLVTHGKKLDGPDPGLTPIGKLQTKRLGEYLPARPKTVVCGTGERHLQTASILGLEPKRFSVIIGTPESKSTEKNIVILANGTKIPYELYTSVADRKEAFLNLVQNLPHLTVVITSRSMIYVLDFNGTPKSAAIYVYEPARETIEELFAASEDIGAGRDEV